MKKIALLLGMLLIFTGFAFSNANSEGATKASVKVGMVTDKGTIDDKSFNQGTWEGIVLAGEDFGVTTQYLQPTGGTKDDYVNEITNLYDSNYKFIITPGYLFSEAVYQAQNDFTDAKFVILDAEPHAGDFAPSVNDNTVAILFAEHEAGFSAGIATALELKEGSVGFIGGIPFPTVTRFSWGFQQGVKYANENLGTAIVMEEENFVYSNSFTDTALGATLSNGMYERGVKAIFVAAGGVGSGAINSAKERTIKGEEVYVIGVDSDQYNQGVYEGNKSVILTSALKRVDVASYNMIKAELAGEFPGGQTLTFDLSNEGVGIPKVNPNLSSETYSKTLEILEMVKNGDIVVSNVQGDLFE